MKKIVECKDAEGLDLFLGERITIFCNAYFYTGKLVGISETTIKLEDAGIVYETGSFDSNEWENMQKLPRSWYVMKQSIESFGVLNKEK